MEKNNRYVQLLNAIEHERNAEEKFYAKLIKGKSNLEKVQEGVVWYPVKINKTSYTVGEHIEVEIERTKYTEFSHKFKTGTGCNLFIQEDHEKTSYSGVISFVQRNTMRVILRSDNLDLSDFSNSTHWGVELIYDERPYQIMKNAVIEVVNSKDPYISDLRQGIDTLNSFQEKLPNEFPAFSDPALNMSQQNAINGAINAKHFAIIHGPPGTGKTTTLIKLIVQLSKKEKQILVCAPGNNAVDLIAKALNDKGINIVRVGNITRIDDNISHLSIDEKVRAHQDWQHVKKVKIEAEEARRQAGKFKRNFGVVEREERSNLYREAKELKKWAYELEDRILDDVLKNAQVILTTLVGVTNKFIENLKVKTLIIDEASQAMEPESWNAILRCQRVIMAGDHMQLPPTVKSPEAVQLGLSDTLLQRMVNHLHHSYLLNTQYRMNDAILSFPNQKFYDNKLQSAEQNKNHLLKGDEHPLCFIDTAGTGFEEKINPEHQSRFNDGEFFIIREHLLLSIERLMGVEIGIIAPYAEQVRFIRNQISEDEQLKLLNIRVDSIDGFQGQEQDIIYFSLVRSNEKGELGFLKDYRRLNVALTRARMKLVLVGDSGTLANDEVYNELIEHITANGTYSSAWEYMA